jgi:hypothetical protein
MVQARFRFRRAFPGAKALWFLPNSNRALKADLHLMSAQSDPLACFLQRPSDHADSRIDGQISLRSMENERVLHVNEDKRTMF